MLSDTDTSSFKTSCPEPPPRLCLLLAWSCRRHRESMVHTCIHVALRVQAPTAAGAIAQLPTASNTACAQAKQTCETVRAVQLRAH